MKQSDYTVSVKNGVGIVFSNGLEVAHGYTTRLGGVSQPPFDALNLGWNRTSLRRISGEIMSCFATRSA